MAPLLLAVLRRCFLARCPSLYRGFFGLVLGIHSLGFCACRVLQMDLNNMSQ
jgi:hypothetical protein